MASNALKNLAVIGAGQMGGKINSLRSMIAVVFEQ
jgi:3-hydroxyacyl-CoA dehydrogenase